MQITNLGGHMKKIQAFLIILATVFILVACQNEKYLNAPRIYGAKDIVYYIGEALPDYLDGISAIDDIDGNITSKIEVDDSEVDLESPGVYNLVYSITNLGGKKAVASILVTVVELTQTDRISPIFFGLKAIHHTIGDDIPDYLDGITASDNIDGDVTHRIWFDASGINLNVAGTYTLTYYVNDQSGNLTHASVQVFVISPEEEEEETTTIQDFSIYYINDLHGALFQDGTQMGLPAIGNFILDEKYNRPDETLFISGGDMLQGTLISNYYGGASTIDLLNDMQLDAFVIGNHEFDWGLEEVTKFFDPSYEGVQANFPLLGANVYLKATNERPNFIDPYTVVEKGDLKIGIIGLMDYGLESSIAVSKIQDYYFGDPLEEVLTYAPHLRNVEQVDIVLVVLHGASSWFNQQTAALTGDARVDAVFNGHTHQTYERFESRNGVSLPILQSGSNGTYVGRLNLILENNVIQSYTLTNLTAGHDQRLATNHQGLQAKLDLYYEDIYGLINDPIITAGTYLSRDDLTYYMAKLMQIKTNSDIAWHNFGGTRTYISNGQSITVATLYDIFPFDNVIKTTYLTGAQIKQQMPKDYYHIKEGISDFEDHVLYKVATNDYIFDQPSNLFIQGQDTELTEYLIRDVIETVLRNLAETETYFYLDSPIILQSQPIFILSGSIAQKRRYTT